jgi:outer membrane protein TolC
LKKSLELKVGKPINTLEISKFQKSFSQKKIQLDTISAMQYNKQALQKASKSLGSAYYPHIRIEDSYSFFGYDDKPLFAGEPIPLLDKQNTLMATLNVHLFDAGVIQKQKEALLLQAQELNEQIIYKTKEQKMAIALALKRIETVGLKIKSSRSALKSARSALETITQKYNAGIVDNVVYLDALSSKTEAKALYEKALNDLEVAYAFYYYYTGKNIEEYIQ